MTILLILLAGGCYENPDYDSYLLLYTGKLGSIEAGSIWFAQLCNTFGFSYDQFRLAIIAIFYTVMGITAYKLIGNKLIIAEFLYVFTPMAFDALNLRNTLANTIIFWAFVYVAKHKKSNWLVFIPFVLLATLFHRSALIYVLLAIPLYCSANNYLQKWSGKTYFKYFLFIIFYVLFFSSDFVVDVLLKTAWSSVAFLLTDTPSEKIGYFTMKGRYGYLLFTGCHLLFTAAVTFIREVLVLKKNRNDNYAKNNNYLLACKIVDIICFSNYVLALILPFTKANSEFYRNLRQFQLLDYIALGLFLKYINKGDFGRQRTIVCFMIAFIINFIAIIYPNIDTLFLPMFTRNRFF